MVVSDISQMMALIGLFAVTLAAMVICALKSGAPRTLTFLMWATATAYGFSGGL